MTGVHSLAFLFIHIECVTCHVHESRVVFRHKPVSSTQGALFLLDSQDLQLQPFLHETRHSCLPLLYFSAVLPCFEPRCCCQERGHDIFTIATEILMGLVRVLPCVSWEQRFAFSLALYYLAGSFHLIFYAYASMSSLMCRF